VTAAGKPASTSNRDEETTFVEGAPLGMSGPLSAPAPALVPPPAPAAATVLPAPAATPPTAPAAPAATSDGPAPLPGVPGSEGVPLPLRSPPSGVMEPWLTHAPADASAPRTFVEPTPAPLPPSPAAKDAEVWFEEAPTRPSALGDIAPSMPGGATRTRTGRTPLPGTPSGIRAASRDTGSTAAAGAATAVDGESLPAVETEQVYDVGGAERARPPWLVPALASAMSLVIGMVLGALLFGGGGGDKQSAAAPPAPQCPECPAAVAAPAPVPTPPAAESADAGVEAVASAGADAGSATGPAPDAPDAPPTASAAGPNLGRGACSMKIQSLPRGAIITVDGVELGAAPLEVSGAPCDTALAVEARFERFELWRREVTLTAEKPRKVMASLRRPRVEVQITSTPPGAVVTIAGKPAGKTPLKAEVPAYVKTSVKIAMAGYKDYDTTVSYKPGKGQALAATLEKAPKGGTTVPSKPAGKPPAAGAGATILGGTKKK
jgi:hypothetical protein